MGDLSPLNPGGSTTFSDAIVPAGVINGVNAAFTLPFAPSPAKSLVLVKNGVTMEALGNDYTLAGLTITYVAAAIPQIGDTHVCWFRH